MQWSGWEVYIIQIWMIHYLNKIWIAAGESSIWRRRRWRTFSALVLASTLLLHEQRVYQRRSSITIRTILICLIIRLVTFWHGGITWYRPDQLYIIIIIFRMQSEKSGYLWSISKVHNPPYLSHSEFLRVKMSIFLNYKLRFFYENCNIFILSFSPTTWNTILSCRPTFLTNKQK